MRRHGDRFLETHQAWVTGAHRRVLRAIAQCRTAALGGHRDREAAGGDVRVQLVEVQVHAYRNDEVFLSGPPSGELVVTAGVQKMAPGLKFALTGSQANTVAVR